MKIEPAANEFRDRWAGGVRKSDAGSTLRVARPVGVDHAHTDHAALKSLRESAAGLSLDDPSKRAFRPQFDAWPGPGTGYTSV